MIALGRKDEAQDMDVLSGYVLATLAEIVCRASGLENIQDEELVDEMTQLFRKQLNRARIRAATQEKEEATLQ